MLPLLRATVQNLAGPRVVREEMVAGMLPLLRATVQNLAGPSWIVEGIVVGMLPLAVAVKEKNESVLK